MLDEDVWSHCWLKSFFYNKIGSTVMYYTHFTTSCDNYYQVLLIITHVWNMINIHMYLEFALCLFPKIAPHASSTNNLFIIKLCKVKNVDMWQVRFIKHSGRLYDLYIELCYVPNWNGKNLPISKLQITLHVSL